MIRLTFEERTRWRQASEGEEGSGTSAASLTEKLLIVGACDINEEGQTGGGGSFTFRPLDSSGDVAKYFSINPASGSAKPGEGIG